MENGASPVIWDHTGLPATRHKWIHHAITPAIQAGTRFTYPGRMEAELTWCWLYTDMVYLSADSHPFSSSNHLIVTRPEVKLTTFRS